MSRTDPGTEPVAVPSGGVSNGSKGDVVVSGDEWTIAPEAISSFGRTVTSADDAAAARSALGLGTAATAASTAFAAAAHDHDAEDISIADPGWTGILVDSGVKNPQDLANFVDELVLGGSDPWTNVILGSDFATTGTANASVTGLSFAPSASKTYLVRVYMLLRTATATVGPRPGIAYPTGLTDAGHYVQTPNSNTAAAFRFQGAIATTNAASTGLPTTTDSYLAIAEALLVVGASPSGSFQITLASETAGTSVTMKAGSFLTYREIS